MLETISTIGLVGYAALNAFARAGSAVSTDAQAVRNAAYAVVSSAERSYALFGAKATAIAQILALAKECANADWDGEDATPVDRRAAISAVDFIRALPGEFALPEFAPEPDGSISLDWIESRSRLFSLSVGTNNRLAYAWLDGADKGHAVARFDGERVPPRILEGIRGVMDRGISTVRPK